MRRAAVWCVIPAVLGLSVARAVAQRPGAFAGNRDHPAIAYSTAPVDDAVSRLNARLAAGAATLHYEPTGGGYLEAVLDALQVPAASQVLAFAQTSQQARQIGQRNPRALYFSDTVSVGWVRGGDVIEVAAQDPRQGTIFYTLAQEPAAAPRFVRNDRCLACHLSWDTLAVPGWVLQTVFPRRSDRDYADGGFVDHRLPVEERWGGWFVTGRAVPPRHMGNQPLLQPAPVRGLARKLVTVAGEFDLSGGYLTPHSDVAALLVLDHQAHALNLLTRLNWEARAGTPARVEEAAGELADYLLFVDEAALPGRVEGASGFAEAFAARGPHDRQGRTLRQLRLAGRTFEYPLSYLVYSPMFDALPAAALDAVTMRLAAVIAGRDTRPKYAHLTPALRAAISDILRDTRPALAARLR